MPTPTRSIYIPAGESKPLLGDYLGDLTDEIQNNRIMTFATGGPKNYGYELSKPDKGGNKTLLSQRYHSQLQKSFKCKFQRPQKFCHKLP